MPLGKPFRFRADYILSQVSHFVKVFFTKTEKIVGFGKITLIIASLSGIKTVFITAILCVLRSNITFFGNCNKKEFILLNECTLKLWFLSIDFCKNMLYN